jgi:hypothetical protein
VSCLVCPENAQREGLCEFHNLAKKKLEQNYKIWQKAYANISYDDYLESLMRLSETGDAILALARLILKHEGGDAGDNIHRL